MSVEQAELKVSYAQSTIKIIDYKPVFMGEEQIKDYSSECVIFRQPGTLDTKNVPRETNHEVSQFSPEFA